MARRRFTKRKQKYSRKSKASIAKWVKRFRRSDKYNFKGRGKYWFDAGKWHCYLYWRE